MLHLLYDEIFIFHLSHHPPSTFDDLPASPLRPSVPVVAEEAESAHLVEESRKPVEDPFLEIPVNAVTLAVDNLSPAVKLAILVVTFNVA